MLQLLEVEPRAADLEGAGQIVIRPKLAAQCLLGWLWSRIAVLLPAAEQGARPDSLGMMPAALGGQGLLPAGRRAAWLIPPLAGGAVLLG